MIAHSFPTTKEEITELQNGFAAAAGFPCVIGAADGVHFPIVVPTNKDLDSFINRKGWASFTCLGVCDHHLRFTSWHGPHPGSASDLRMLRCSSMFMRGNNGILFPEGVEAFVLFDSGFMLLPWAMIPFDYSANLSRWKKRFNKRLSKTRIHVERAFGSLKMRFRCLLQRLDVVCDRRRSGDEAVNMARANDIILSCVVMHNSCVNEKVMDETTIREWLSGPWCWSATLPSGSGGCALHY